VGTTNRTWLADYEAALGPETGLVMVSHTSNYAFQGFVHRPEAAEVAALARQHGAVSFLDLGSGLLLDPRRHGLPPEPTVPEAVAAGFDLVAFSGDKLLGGPQAGLLVGRADLLRGLARSPLARAVRVGKLTLAALEATLRLYLDPDQALQEVPTLAMLRMDPQALRARSQALAGELAARLEGRARVRVVANSGSVGGGGMPGQDLPGWAIQVQPPSGEEQWAERLRWHRLPVLVTCREGSLRLDLRTLPEADEPLLLEAMEATAP
jgi:L-seryl-tRNA(Ser) seleniumtransferase